MSIHSNSPTCVTGTRARLHARGLWILVLAILLGTASTLHAATATAIWDPNTEPNLAGYKLSYGIQSGVYTTVIDVANVTSWVVPNLTAGQRPVRVAVQPNSGLGAARNFGVKISRGRYVALLDADNLFEPSFIERAVDVLEADPEIVYVSCWSRYIDDRGIPQLGPGAGKKHSPQ